MRLTVSLLVFGLLALSGCSANTSRTGHPNRKAAASLDSSQVEYLDREAVVREEVQRQNTRFTVPEEDVALLWKRSKLLASTYINTSSKPKVMTAYSSNGFHLRHFPAPTTTGQRKGFAYEVKVRPSSDSLNRLVEVFVVNMTTGAQDNDALMLAKNISRFLETGVLERNLLIEEQVK